LKSLLGAIQAARNWGLDDCEENLFYHNIGNSTARLSAKAQQLTHNVFRTFSGRGTLPLIFTNLDSVTSGNWSGHYGAAGFVIADSTDIWNTPSFAIILQGQTSQA